MTPYRDAAYYQDLHDHHPNYQNNNWLLDELANTLSFGVRSVLEIACGNGRYLELAAPHFEWVYGCDWAVSPRIQNIMREHSNVLFFPVDLYQSVPMCSAELVVSADFLEHIKPESLSRVMSRIDLLASKQFHKIACYDDGNSHLSVLSPEQWLRQFQTIDPRYKLERVEKRLDMADKVIAVFSRGRP